jgi:hypothetical protein
MSTLDEEIEELQDIYGFNDVVRKEYNVIHVYFQNFLVIFTTNELYPKESPIVEVYDENDNLDEKQTLLIQECANGFTGEPMLDAVIRYAEEILPKPKIKKKSAGKDERKNGPKPKGKTKEQIKKEQMEELKKKNQVRMEEKLKQKEFTEQQKKLERTQKEQQERVQLDPEVLKWTNYSKINKDRPKIIKTQDEMDALNVSGSSGTLLELVQDLNHSMDSREDKIFILSKIKAISTRSVNPEYKESIIQMRAYIDVMKILQAFGDKELKDDPFVIEVLIYSTFLISQVIKDENSASDIYRLDCYEFLWRLSRRKTKQIRQHCNDIISKLAKEKTFTSDLKKALTDTSFCDFKFICGDDVEFPCHKCIINARCVNIDLQKDSFIVKSTVKSNVVKKFLEFVYTNTIYFTIGELQEGLDKEINRKEMDELFQFLKHSRELENVLKFNIKKNEKGSTYSDDISSMFRFSNPYSDLKLSMINKIENIVEIPVNKIILASRSEFFYNMFNSGLSESTQDVISIDFNHSVMKCVLWFIYTDAPVENNNLKNNSVIEILIAADLYMLHSLKVACEKKIITLIDESNIEVLNQIAHDYNCETLEEAIVTFATRKGISLEQW